IAAWLMFGSQIVQRIMRGHQKRVVFRPDRHGAGANGAISGAAFRIIMPERTVALAERQDHPEAQAPFTEPGRLPGSDDAEGRCLCIGPVEMGAAMREGGLDQASIRLMAAKADVRAWSH